MCQKTPNTAAQVTNYKIRIGNARCLSMIHNRRPNPANSTIAGRLGYIILQCDLPPPALLSDKDEISGAEPENLESINYIYFHTVYSINIKFEVEEKHGKEAM